MDSICIAEECNPGLECIFEGPGYGICSEEKARAEANPTPKSKPKPRGKA